MFEKGTVEGNEEKKVKDKAGTSNCWLKPVVGGDLP
jgi:hypothetical protein